jgi:predicted Mrr-cat superfamily restriction endonuclease
LVALLQLRDAHPCLALFAQYDRLDADPRAELPLKRIWVVAAEGE